ncbi:hypothetical protein GGX14DRAFT_397441 [Mycena pura]|uniref:Uncharacterized protein n=1 Tax=Mycena pura TaxID=153505 RepID=A0AAD6VC69_9AGAR|nr:hypothetical protein GGX14DRAFT_397441 [Mycena pura]
MASANFKMDNASVLHLAHTTLLCSVGWLARILGSEREAEKDRRTSRDALPRHHFLNEWTSSREAHDEESDEARVEDFTDIFIEYNNHARSRVWNAARSLARSGPQTDATPNPTFLLDHTDATLLPNAHHPLPQYGIFSRLLPAASSGTPQLCSDGAPQAALQRPIRTQITLTNGPPPHGHTLRRSKIQYFLRHCRRNPRGRLVSIYRISELSGASVRPRHARARDAPPTRANPELEWRPVARCYSITRRPLQGIGRHDLAFAQGAQNLNAEEFRKASEMTRRGAGDASRSRRRDAPRSRVRRA